MSGAPPLTTSAPGRRIHIPLLTCVSPLAANLNVGKEVILSMTPGTG